MKWIIMIELSSIKMDETINLNIDNYGYQL
jgi:hypothetical protein